MMAEIILVVMGILIAGVFAYIAWDATHSKHL